MRYYNFTLCANEEQIKENTTINLREYAYETGLVSNFHSQTPFVKDKKPLTELPHNKTKSFNNS